MGRAKLLLETPDGSAFIESIINQYVDFDINNIIIVVNSDGAEIIAKQKLCLSKKIKLVINDHPEFGRFNSISLGVEQVNTYFVFIHNIDNPYAEINVLQKLYVNRINQEIVKPTYNGKNGHPILISKNICRDIISEKKNDIRLDVFLKTYNSLCVEVDSCKIHTNINTQGDYCKHFE